MNRREFLTEVGKVVVVLPAGFAWIGCTKKSANNADLTGGVGALGVGGAAIGPATGGTSSIQPPRPQTGAAGLATLDAASLLGSPDSGTAGIGGMGTSGAGGMGTAGMQGVGGGAAGMGTAGMGTGGMGASGAGGMTGTGGTTGSALQFTSSITESHTHDFSIQMSAIATPPSAGVSGMTTLNSGHTHMVMITMAQLTMIMGGMTVMVTTTGGTHTHTFSFHK